mgnify:FL=1
MKNVAILTAGFAPVPAVDGGAVETLTTQLINANEKYKWAQFDVYTVSNPKLDALKYDNTIIIQAKRTSPIIAFSIRVFNKICAMLHLPFAYGINDWSIVDSFLEKEYDAVLFENNMHIYHLFQKKYLSKYALFFHLHNSIENDPGKPPRLSHEIANSAKGIITVSDYIHKQMDEYQPSRIKTVYNCADSDVFRPVSSEERKKIRYQYGIQDDEFAVLYGGRMTPEKGILELILALKKLNLNYNKKVHLLIAGKNWFNSRTESKYAQILKEAVEGVHWIDFTGYVENHKIYELYNAVDITTVPSIIDEAFGMTALESLLCSTPVIASNRGGLPEVVSNDVGLVVEYNEHFVDNIAGAILHYINNRDAYISAKKNCREYALGKFGQIESYYKNIMKEIG